MNKNTFDDEIQRVNDLARYLEKKKWDEYRDKLPDDEFEKFRQSKFPREKTLFERVLSRELDTKGFKKTIKNIGAISTGFTEIGIKPYEIYREYVESSEIKEVGHKDVTGKYFKDWFFKMDDWAGINPKQFPFSMITHSDEISVYGYFNDNKLDGIIRVDEYDDYYYLSFFFVNKARQHQGIGQSLFRYILRRFKDKKIILFVYTDNSPAIHIYKKYGFKIIDTAYGVGYRPDNPHYIMQRDIQ